MKALVLEAYNTLVYREVPDPVAAAGEVLIRVRAAGICGSDIHGMDGSTGRRIPPIIMGHEAAGTVESVGEGVSGWEPGDRVTFDSTVYRLDDWYTLKGHYNLSDDRRVLGVSTPEFKMDGAYAELVAVPRHIVYPLPESVSFTQAAMTEPIAVALHSINLCGFSADDTAVVVGTGMVGLFLIQLLRIKGLRKVIAIDNNPDKLGMALTQGASHAFNPETTDVVAEVRSHTQGRGADVGFEVVGLPETVNTAISCIRRGATLALVGNITAHVDIPLQDVVSRQLRLQGSCAINGEYPEVLQLLNDGKIDTGSLLSAEAPLSEGAKWFDRLSRKESGLIKVVLIP